MSKVSAVARTSTIGRQRTGEEFPGPGHTPVGAEFEAYLRRESSSTAAPPASEVPLVVVPPLELLELSAPDDEELSWQERALCAQTDPEAFFPEKGGSTRDAKKVCVSCEVRSQCLDYALAHDERFGIWGGLSERERRRLKKQAG